MDTILIVVLLGILYFLAHAFASFFGRTKIPDVLWLMTIGLLLGPVLGLIQPSTTGELSQVFVTITLVVILFQGGLGISYKTFVSAWRGLYLTVLNFLATVAVVGIVSIMVAGLHPLTAFMLGAILGGTSSAVVIPMLNHLRMQTTNKTILILESALTDVLCIVIALALLDFELGNGQNLGLTIGSIVASFFVAIIIGMAGAILWSILLKKIRTVQDSIFATPAFVFIIFGASELLGFSGFIAALSFGITIGNAELLERLFNKNRSICPSALNVVEKSFFSEIVFLLKTFFFIYIGLSITLSDLWLIWVGLILAILCFILRIPVIRFSISKNTSIREAALMSVIVPKGLAAAALASIPLQRGIAGGDVIQGVTFAVVFFTITLTSILVWLVHETAFVKLFNRVFSRFSLQAPQEIEATTAITPLHLEK